MDSPIATTSMGTTSVFDSVLNNALSKWQKVEEIKAIKATTGQDRLQAVVQPELDNGSAVIVDSPAQAPTQAPSGINYGLLYPSLALLAVGLFLKYK